MACKVLGVAAVAHETCSCTIAAVGPATPTTDPVVVPGKLPVGAPTGTVVITSAKEVFVSRGTLIDLDDSTESIAPNNLYASSTSSYAYPDDELTTFSDVHADPEKPVIKRAKKNYK